LLFHHNTMACLNYYVIDSSGHRHMHEDYPPSAIYLYTKSDIEELKFYEKKIPTASGEDQYKFISNYCATLIKLGRYKESIPMLEKQLQARPGEYELNANIEVAYELDGQLDLALTYLKKAMQLNPSAHRHSEWFHLRIVEAAIEQRDQHTDIAGMNILKIERDSSKEIAYQIAEQLKERVPLTQSANPLLSKAIEESADFYKAHMSLEWAIELYAIAIGYCNDPLTENRLWQKIHLSREKLLIFKDEGNQGSVSKYLYKGRWEKTLRKLVKKWKDYTPYYYQQPVVTNFN
jgi:tetratricopeptide (TPR) repeat protein